MKWADPTLTLAGDGWWLSLTCPWRLATTRGLAYGWASEDVEDRVWDLSGSDVTRIVHQGSETYTDPLLVLSNGDQLEVFSDELDPWSLRAGDLTIVGPLERDDW